ncbi:MAG: GNAT family N-acetyltransferase [Dehalococcoidia bacterium]|nr:GNAT family N-acetyltransferase [Dehalococcoidia bacterium]
MPEDTLLRIDPAIPGDIPLILDFIHELAAYEHEPEAATATPQQLHQALFGPRPAAEAAIARYNGQPAALALWFQNFSTWTGRPGLWLEDLFVRPDYRRKGVARAIMGYLASLAVDRGYGRLEWSALDWNQPAIDFYATLDSRPMDEWTTYRLTGPALTRLAAES